MIEAFYVHPAFCPVCGGRGRTSARGLFDAFAFAIPCPQCANANPLLNILKWRSRDPSTDRQGP
jgi:hypothetical protein